MRIARSIVPALVGLLVVGCVAAPTMPTADEVRTLAPTGKLRVGLYLGGPPNVIRDAASGEMKGVGYELGRELARRLGVSFEPVVYQAIGALVEGAKSREWDIACITATTEREPIMDFTTPFLAIEHGYMVTGASPIKTIAEVDRAGIRVGVPKGGALEPILMRTLKHAQLVPGPGLMGVSDMLKSGKVDVFAANKANLFEMSDRLPGSRVLDGHYAVDHLSIAVTKGHRSAVPFLEKFIDEAKASGLVKSAAARAGLRGAVEE
jgi:polar amino acid transport system substrate-binding protein